MAEPEEFTYDAGHLIVDLANTVDERLGEPLDLLADYGALVRWCRGAGLLTKGEAAILQRVSKTDPRAAEKVVARAREIREACFEILEAASRDDHFPPKALELIHKLYYEMVSHRAMSPGAQRVEWVWLVEPTDLDRMLWPIGDLATELITSDLVGRVRGCQGNLCARLFVDNSRQGNRRWCDMSRCGNRAKVRRHYHKTRSGPRGRG